MDNQYKRSSVRDQLTPICLAKTKELGHRFRSARKRRGWSIEATAELAGVSKSTIKQIEAGDLSVGFAYYVAMLDLYGMITDIDALCTTSHDALAPNLYPNGVTAFEFDKEI